MLINRHIFGHEQKLAHADNLLKAQPSSFLQEMFFLDLLQKRKIEDTCFSMQIGLH